MHPRLRMEAVAMVTCGLVSRYQMSLPGPVTVPGMHDNCVFSLGHEDLSHRASLCLRESEN